MQGIIDRDRIAALVFLTFSVAYGVVAYDIELYFVSPDDVFTPRTFPIALSWAGGIVAFCMLILPRSGAPELSIATIRAMDWPRIAVLCVLMVLYGLTIKSIGFFIATTVFLMAGYALLGERRWWMLLVCSLPIAAGFQFVLHGLLGIYIVDPALEALGVVGR